MRDDDYAGFLPNDRNEGDDEQQPETEPEPSESLDHQASDDQETEGMTITITPPERRDIPRPFLSMMAELGFEALNQWLETQAAPQQITDLAEALHQAAAMLETDFSDEFLGLTCRQIATGCHYVGTNYEAGGSEFPA